MLAPYLDYEPQLKKFVSDSRHLSYITLLAIDSYTSALASSQEVELP